MGVSTHFPGTKYRQHHIIIITIICLLFHPMGSCVLSHCVINTYPMGSCVSNFIIQIKIVHGCLNILLRVWSLGRLYYHKMLRQAKLTLERLYA